MMVDGNSESETLAFTSGPRELSLTVMETMWGESGFTENIKHLVLEHVKFEMLIRHSSGKIR